MALVKAGDLWMGPPGTSDHHYVEVPTFAIDPWEATAGDYSTCVDELFCSAPPTGQLNETFGVAGKEEHPINWVNWFQANEFCLWQGKRLCTEAEWEKAARGGCAEHPGKDCEVELPVYPWGDDFATCAFAHMNSGGPGQNGCGTGQTAPVGTYPDGASPFDVLDMAGNVDEWVKDCWHPSLAEAPNDGTAWETDCSSAGRVVRGGSYVDGAGTVLATTRKAYQSSEGNHSIGFRCCWSPD